MLKHSEKHRCARSLDLHYKHVPLNLKATSVFHHVSVLNPVILLKCSMFLVTNVYPLMRVIPAMIAFLKSIGVPMLSSVERISLDFLELSRFKLRIFIEFSRLSACLMFIAAFFDLKAPK